MSDYSCPLLRQVRLLSAGNEATDGNLPLIQLQRNHTQSTHTLSYATHRDEREGEDAGMLRPGTTQTEKKNSDEQ